MALTENGLQIKKLSEMIPEVVGHLQTNVDPDIDVDDSDPLYQVLVIFLSQVDQLWQLGQAIYNSGNPYTAEGVSLDNVGAITGVIRNASTNTAGLQYFTGDIGTVINAGTILQNVTTKDRFVVPQTVQLSLSRAISCVIQADEVVNEDLYTVVVGSNSYTYESDTDATAAEILAGIKAEIDADISPTVTATISGTQLTVAAIEGTVSISTTANLGILRMTGSGVIQAEEVGPIPGNANTVSVIVTPVLGLTSTTNPVQFSLGRNRESDVDYRQRILTEQTATGAATVPAIEARLRNITGVTYASVIPNATMAVDGDGRPPKSIEAIVQGGDDNEIGLVLWEAHAAGIETYGSTSVVITDSDGQPQAVEFSRPSPVYIAVRITYELYPEEIFPDSGEDDIKIAVIDYVSSLGLDKDVFPTRLSGPIYKAVDGLGPITVELQVLDNAGDSPVELDWSTAPIPIADASFAQTTLSDVYVEEA
jgi:uncharacterized phage protein gp47/JayE